MTERFGMGHTSALQFERSYGYESEEAKRIKIGSKVVVAGLGGGGGMLAVMLAAEGYGNISIIDGDRYDASNWRVPYVGENSIGQLKTDVTAEAILNKNPDVNLKVYSGRFDPDCAEDFMLEGTKKNQIVVAIDEIDIKGSGPAAALHFAQTARKLAIPVTSVTDIGKGGGTVTSYNPHSRYTYERVNGIREGVTYDTYSAGELDLSGLAYLPPYGSIDTFQTVLGDDSVSVPAHPRSVLVATGLGLSEVERIVFDGKGMRYPKPTWAPRMRWVDVDGTNGSTRFPRLSSKLHLGHAIIRDKLFRINPATSYSAEDIDRRKRDRGE